MSPLTDPLGPDLKATLRALKLGKLADTLPERLTLGPPRRRCRTPTSSSSSCPMKPPAAKPGSIGLRAGRGWTPDAARKLGSVRRRPL